MAPPKVSRIGRFRAVAVVEVWGSRFWPEGRTYRHEVYAVCDTADAAVEAIHDPPPHAKYTPRYLAGPGGRDSRVKLSNGQWWWARGRVPRGAVR